MEGIFWGKEVWISGINGLAMTNCKDGRRFTFEGSKIYG